MDDLISGLDAVDRDRADLVVVREFGPAPAPLGKQAPAPAPPGKQALVFVKPELLYPGLDRAGNLGAVLRMLGKAGLTIGAAAVLGPARLADVIAGHYAMINRVSRLGVDGLTPAAARALRDRFGGDEPVLGGSQILARPGASLDDLIAAWPVAGSVKLAPGAYAATINIGGERVVALNGFHPEQLAHYTTADARVVAVEVTWETPGWREFRSEIIGATDPYAADARSIRAYIRDHRVDLGVPEVDRGVNGVHASAGPLEAMVELCRFFAVPPSATAFGAAGAFDRLPDDADLHRLFEATEDCEPAEALRAINRWPQPDTTPARGRPADI
ncbi:hypothetical protein [Paractinoplanes toevensis]|uniref:hypothetical protein n=1 Tax=Paractinoplanes toevensis TaxID=571911 RepID=UPI001BB3D055|nr:hypothetical protein [Actinoplanes toevensis]